MPVNLKGRSFLTLKDFTPDEIRYMLNLAADQRMDRIHQTIAPNLDQVVQGVDTPASAVPVPVFLSSHVNQAVMLFMPVIWSVSFQYARLVKLQVSEQVRLPCCLNLLFGYAGHNTGTAFRFIVLSPPSSMIA